MERIPGWYATVALFFLMASGTNADTPVAEGAAELEGTWRFVSWEIHGERAPASAIKNYRWVIRGKQANWSSGFIPEQNLTREEKYTFEVDPSKSPKWIDLTLVVGKKRKVVRGIYESEGRRLKFCLPSDPQEGPKDRPADFQAKAGSGLMLMVLERVEDK